MGIFGVDVSNHQAAFDFRGWDFAFLKLSEGTGFVDGRFRQHWANARNAGLMVVPYHYVRGGDVQGQYNLISRLYGPGPIILDAEEGTPSAGVVRDLQNLLNRNGYRTPLTYIPRWYWSGHLGSPSLAGLAPIWASWYPDYVARPKEQGIAKVPTSAWSPYGGLNVALMQFTSTPFDQNYYPGSREQLADLLYGAASGGGGSTDEGDPDMPILVKGDQDNEAGHAIYSVTSSVEDFAKRHVQGLEAAVLEKAGIKPTVLPQDMVDAIPNIQDTLNWRQQEELKSQIAAGFGTLADDETNIVAALRQLPTGGQVDIPAFVAALVPALAPALPQGVTVEQMESVLVDSLNNVRLTTGGK